METLTNPFDMAFEYDFGVGNLNFRKIDLGASKKRMKALDPKCNINDLDQTNMKIIKRLFIEYFYIIHLDFFKEGLVKD